MAYTKTKEHVDLAHSLLKALGIPRDNLPYTTEFNDLYAEFIRRRGGIDWLDSTGEPTRNEFWKLLCSAAKKGGLSKERVNCFHANWDKHNRRCRDCGITEMERFIGGDRRPVDWWDQDNI